MYAELNSFSENASVNETNYLLLYDRAITEGSAASVSREMAFSKDGRAPWAIHKKFTESSLTFRQYIVAAAM